VSGKSTSTIDRPAVPPRASDRGRSRLGDLSRPIPIDRRIARRRRSNALLALVAIAIAGALGAALFVLPVQTWFQQDVQLAERAEQLSKLRAVNDDLRSEVARLRTDDGVREAARDQLGYVEDGEVRKEILELPPVPTDLPDGWPYRLVEGIAELRRNPPVAVAPAVPAPQPATAPAPTATVTSAGSPAATAPAPSAAPVEPTVAPTSTPAPAPPASAAP
jgi:cell division protein FtsB